jgi:histidine triad (HIT) family protein
MSTIFSKIINREVPAEIVYEDNNLLAFHDISPQAPVHIIIIPKKEIDTLNNLCKEDEIIVGKMVILAKNLAKEFKINLSGYRTVFNCNEDGGQTVYHIHLHLLGGRKLEWPP